MKKLLITVMGVFIALWLTGAVAAQDSNTMYISPPAGGPSQLFGQNQWYSVVFRGNGEAVVSLRTVFTNTNTAAEKSLSFRVPRVNPTDLMAFQVIRQGSCIRYAPLPLPQTDQGSMMYPRPSQQCIEYSEPDMNSWYGPAKYQKTDIEFSGDTITILFPQPVQPNKTGSVILYYRAFGYAKKDLAGAYNFAFETLKAQDSVQQLQVGISTDSDLNLRGTKSSVNYRFEDVNVAAKGMMGISAPSANPRMDSYYQQIGQGQLIKNASNLQALESFTVKGSYADSTPKLYAKEVAVGTGIVILLILGIIAVLKFLLKTDNRSPQTKTENTQATGIILSFVLSFMSALLTTGFGILLLFVMRNLGEIVGYDIAQLVAVLMLILSLAMFGFLIIGPALFIGIKRGWGYGVATAGLTIFWMFGAIILIVFAFRQNYQAYPVAPGIMNIKAGSGTTSAPSGGID